MEPSIRFILPRAILATVLLTILLSGCSAQSPSGGSFTLNPNADLDWKHTIGPMLSSYCGSCHGSSSAQNGFDATSYNAVISHVTSSGHRVVIPGDPAQSELLSRVKGQGFPQMPPGGYIGNDNVQAIEEWITNNAPEDLSATN